MSGLAKTIPLCAACTLALALVAPITSKETTPPVSGVTATYYIPYALHLPLRDEDGALAKCKDADGSSHDGNDRPRFDTLVVATNPTEQDVKISYNFFRGDGAPVPWGDGKATREYLLRGGRMHGTSLVKGNVYQDPPQDFVGYATIKAEGASADQLAVYTMLGGGGCYPRHWTGFSASVPAIGASNVAELRKSVWSFAYLIPYFDRPNYAGPRSYRTGMVLTNFDTKAAWFWITYTVADFYKGIFGWQGGETFTFKHRLGAGESWVTNVYDQLPGAGFPAKKNSEGWLRIEAKDSDKANAKSQDVAMIPYLLVGNRDYDVFSAGIGAQ